MLYVSPAFERIWGLPVEQLYGESQTWFRVVHPDDQDSARQAFEAWSRDGTPETLRQEYRVLRPDGSIRWVENTGTLIRDEQKRICRTSGVARDITERKAADALRESEQQFRDAMRLSAIGMALAAPDGRLLQSQSCALQDRGIFRR